MKKVILVLSVLAFLPGSAFACKCVPPPAVAVAFDQAGAVFEGTVTEVPTGTSEIVTFKVHRGWKGDVKETAAVKSNAHVNMCAYEFTAGQKYLVYATKDGAEWSTSICSRTKLARRAKTEMKKLDRLKKP